jgi:branched-chain amino acid transport system ATP-binding protein
MLEPRVILADELSFGIAPILVDKVIGAIRRVSVEKHVSVLLVEQNAPVAFSIAEHVYILDSGNVSHEGSAEQLKNHVQIREMYFGLV